LIDQLIDWLIDWLINVIIDVATEKYAPVLNCSQPTKMKDYSSLLLLSIISLWQNFGQIIIFNESNLLALIAHVLYCKFRCEELSEKAAKQKPQNQLGYGYALQLVLCHWY